MTSLELNQKIRESKGRLESRSSAIIIYVRVLVPILKDAKAERSAKELERLLFEYDAEVQESIQFISDNMTDILKLMSLGEELK